jgi:hypothetical protein
MSDYIDKNWWENIKWQELTHETLEKANGPNFIGDKFNPLIRNFRTGLLMNNTHHCGWMGCGDKPRSKQCFSLEKLHFAGCLATVQDENGKDVPCGEVFQVRSNGCAKHPYVEGFNHVFREYIRGKDLTPETKGIKVKTQEEIDAERREQEVAEAKVKARTWRDWEEVKTTKQRQEAEAKQAERVEKHAKLKTTRKTSKLQPAQTAKNMLSKKK